MPISIPVVKDQAKMLAEMATPRQYWDLLPNMKVNENA
jgi:hypothetical protein